MKVKKILSCLLICFVVMIAGCGAGNKTADSKTAAESKQETASNSVMKVKMLDVGQGDAILVQTQTQTILIDTSDTDETEKLLKSLQDEKIKTIDKLILTHPHADHIGGTKVVFKNFTVKQIYDNGQPHSSKLYLNYLKTIKEKKIKYKSLRDGDVLDFGSGAKFYVLSPTEKMVKDKGMQDGKVNLNLNSVMGRLVYGKFSMMFTGDAEEETEQALLTRHKASELKSDVLKSGHHGSNTSSSKKFIEAVKPTYAVISCGTGNKYHHPHPSIRKLYKAQHIDFYRTDRNGKITIETNGKTWSISPSKGKVNDGTNN